MFIEFLGNQPICIDDRPIMRKVRCNIVSKNQLRLKLVFIDNELEIPIDLIVYNISYPRVVLNGAITIGIIGEEYRKHMKFKIHVCYSFLKNTWTLNGIINGKEIKQTVDKSSLKVMIEFLKELLKN